MLRKHKTPRVKALEVLLNWQLPLLFEDYYTILQHIGNFQDTKGDMSDYLVSLTPLKKRDSAMYSKRLLIDVR